MKRLERSDLRTNAEYPTSRLAFRSFVIQVKSLRRLPLGPLVSVVFESQRTLLYELQEYLLASGIEDEAGIAQALEDTNSRVPRDHELAATLFIESPRRQVLEEWLPRLAEIGSCVALGVGDSINVRARAETERVWDSGMSTIQYLKFPFPGTALEAIARRPPLRLYVDLPGYQHARVVPEALVDDLARDLESASPDDVGEDVAAAPRTGPRIRPYLSVSGVYKSPQPPDDPDDT